MESKSVWEPLNGGLMYVSLSLLSVMSMPSMPPAFAAHIVCLLGQPESCKKLHVFVLGEKPLFVKQNFALLQSPFSPFL